MKKLFLIMGLVALAGCAPESKPASTISGLLASTPGFEGCVAADLFDGVKHLYVIRCPNSDASVGTTGKGAVHATTIEVPHYVNTN